MRLRHLATAGLVAMLATTTLAAAAPAPNDLQPVYEATIRRTSNGIPHVVGASYADVMYGVGYAFAQDNICTAADFYVTVNAERSKWFGPDATWGFNGNGTTNTNRESDFFYASVNASGRIEELLVQPAPHGPLPGVRQGVAGYVAGYNAWLAEVGGPDGLSDPRCKGAAWVRPITEMDAYRRFYQLASLASRGVAINGIGGAQPPTPSIVPFGEADQAALDAATIDALVNDFPQPFSEALGIGSNAIALGADVTDNGRGIVLGNPHFPWHGGERLYQFHYEVPGVAEASGAALYGVPLVLIGHTDGLAWSHTVSTAYRFTPFELTLVPGSPTTYLVDGVPTPMSSIDLTIEVRNDDGTIGAETRTLYSTVYGPVLTSLLGLPIFPWTPEKAFAIADANDHLRYLNHFFETNHAQTVGELLEVIQRNQGVPWVNTIAADHFGDVLYSDISVVPNVPDPKALTCNTAVGAAAFEALGLPVLDGSRSDCNWDSDADAIAPGIFGPANLPHLQRRDYVHNGNDSYWLSNPNQPLTGYARIIGDEAKPRSLRTRLGLQMIEDRLAGNDEFVGVNPTQFTQGIVADLVFNNRNLSAELFRDDVVTLCRNAPALPTTSGPPVAPGGACDALANWNLRDDLDAPGAPLWRRFMENLTGLTSPVVADTPGQDVGGLPWADSFDPTDPVHTPATINVADPRVALSLGQAITDLSSHGIALDAQLRGLAWEDRGDGVQIPVHGGPGTLGVFNAIKTTWSDADGAWSDVPHGSSFVMSVQFTDTDCPITNAIVTYSQSEDITSPWFKDQTLMFSDKRWNDFHYCESDVLADPNLTEELVTSASTPAVAPTGVDLPATGGGLGGAGLVGLVGLSGVAAMLRRGARGRRRP